jgi:hypothetical protein
MTRDYAAKRLLEHGPLTLPEFAAITGWGYLPSWRVANKLVASGAVKRVHIPGVTYQAYQLA